jgi:hypothetical protein
MSSRDLADSKRALWRHICAGHGVLQDSVPLFVTDNHDRAVLRHVAKG